MTKRIRFSPFSRAGVFAVGLGLAASGARAGEVPFTTQPPISTTANGADLVTAADIDGDGDTDALSASYYGDAVHWYENSAGDGSAWTIRTISTATDGPYGAFAADVDGDGDQDVVSASGIGDRVAWHENAAGNGTLWTLHTIATANFPRSVFGADVDGDGDVDVLSATTFENKVAWHENTAGDGTLWTLHTISLAASAAFSVFAADVDGDGDMDALSASVNDDKVAWYENTAGNGTLWTTRTISTAADGARSVFAADVDDDGDVDALSASREDDTVAWYENTAGDGTLWTLRTISTAGDGSRSVFAADVDGDGDMDALSASSYDNKVAWYENSAGDGTLWILRTISTGAVIAISVFAADVDGDGDLDALSASAIDDKIAWYRNDTIHGSACFVTPPPVSTVADGVQGVAAADVDGDGDTDALAALSYVDRAEWHENAAGNGSAWTPRTVATALDQVYAVTPADVDGDGDLDTFSIGYYSGLRWHRNEAGNGTTWTGLPIGATGFAAAAADVDGDGDLDALGTTNFFDPLVKWYENVAGDGSAWSFHTIALVMGGASFSVAAGDLDGDGDVDVVAPFGPGPSQAVLWFENTAGNGSTWTPRTVSLTEARASAPADVDHDGDLDVVTAGLGGASWHENLDGTGALWTTHAVAPSSALTLSIRDLDSDGDLDFAQAGSPGAPVQWHENTAGNGSAWTTHTLVTSPSWGTGVASADIDGDGSPDVLAALAAEDRVAWLQNQAGQFSLAASDTAPSGAVNGELVPMLSVVATHAGRAGDGDLELSGLGLLFEEAPGDPLTSGEANAVVESLRVYRDANGNGVFDPGSDVLVATVADLALTNGIQAVSFTDGDPSVQVSFGTPRTYFVVTELTANASQQTPNEFRVTHLALGPAASTAEDRTYDIVLRPACPADVSSSVIGPITPVELLGFTVE